MEELKHVMELLVNEGKLPAKYRPHPLRGDKMGTFECHIRPDWLLLWQQDDDELIMLMTNTLPVPLPRQNAMCRQERLS